MPRFWAIMLAGGLTTVACTRPDRAASTRAVVLPICTIVTSLPGVRPIFCRAYRAMKSDEDPNRLIATDPPSTGAGEFRCRSAGLDPHRTSLELLRGFDIGASQKIVIER